MARCYWGFRGCMVFLSRRPMSGRCGSSIASPDAAAASALVILLIGVLMGAALCFNWLYDVSGVPYWAMVAIADRRGNRHVLFRRASRSRPLRGSRHMALLT